MADKEGQYPWRDKICSFAQVGGIETSVLDDGLGRSARIAWINTGSGLRYKVVIDRAMNIADAFFNQHSLAWISHAGVAIPRPNVNEGLQWLYSFGGGLLATCGLAHAGGPESDESEKRALHGRISDIPAAIESINQPDPAVGKLDMSITGVVREAQLFGANLELKRTISSTIGEPTIRIHDVVTNRGSIIAPHMMLYHCNFGWPLVDEGTDIVWKGDCESRGLDMDNALFNSGHNYRKCINPIENHRGGGESCGFIDVTPDSNGICTVGFNNRKLNMALAMTYKKKQLPALCNWQHWGFGEYVCALEPGTNPPIGLNKAREQKELITIAPGESKTYDLELTVLTDEKQIGRFLKAAGQ